jgi:hypothetical protein
MVRKVASEVVHFRKFFNRCKIKWNKAAAVELLTQMVRKEASKVVHFFSESFSTGAKLPKKHVRLLSKIKWNKFTAFELLT